MSEARKFPFGGVPVYNPQSLSKGEALAQFHARQAAYQSLMDLLRQERPSHVLIIGTRGMGKTTLLQRVRYGIEDDAELNSRYLPLVFPEEQYNVNRLHHFLLNTVDAVADALEKLGNERMLARVEAYAETARKLSELEMREDVPGFLAEIGRELGRSFLLLVDNADRLFDTIEKQEQWTLRELLAGRHDFTFLGATNQASEGIYGSDRAFFEFFRVLMLMPLTLAEVRDLLLQLSESVEESETGKGTAKLRVEKWLAADPARLHALVQLTGGNPRTTVMLFHLVLDGLEGRAREYLEQLLDQCTPNYKGRVDELPAQAQQVLDSVALRWDPVTAMEVAADTGLETNAVSTQLTRLVRQGILEKADPGDSKKALYQVAERFFNIWYLMRASRRVRAKLRWFVEFLRVFFESGELEQMAWDRLERFRSARQSGSAEIETAFAYALASGRDRYGFEEFLRRECADRETLWRPYLELMGCSANHDVHGFCAVEAPGTTGQGPFVTSPDPIETLRRAVEIEPGNAMHWRRLGRSLAKKREFAGEAEAALRRATELEPQAAGSWLSLGILLAEMPMRSAEAEAALRKSIELDPKQACSWASLAQLLWQTSGRLDEAEAAIRMAIELEPESAGYRHNLGLVLIDMPERREEAEAAFRKAIELDPKSAVFWTRLGTVLAEMHGRLEEAEKAFDKALEMNPRSGYLWGSVGVFLACQAGKPRKAELALRKSVELEPEDPRNLRNLGVLLYCELGDKPGGVRYIRQALQFEPADPVSAAILAACVRESEAEEDERLQLFMDKSREADIWSNLLILCRNYAPFGTILLGICDLVQEQDSTNERALLHRAVALAQLGDFPRASVALDDALVGDPIDLLSTGRRALEVFFAAAVKSGRVRDCIEVLDKKGWKDAWRPIYEALRSVEEGSAEYLKRVAVEIRDPALVILRRIAPELPAPAAVRSSPPSSTTGR